MKLIGGASDDCAGWEVRALESPPACWDNVRESSGVGHAGTEPFFDDGREIGQGLDFLSLGTSLCVGEDFPTKAVVSGSIY